MDTKGCSSENYASRVCKSAWPACRHGSTAQKSGFSNEFMGFESSERLVDPSSYLSYRHERIARRESANRLDHHIAFGQGGPCERLSSWIANPTLRGKRTSAREERYVLNAWNQGVHASGTHPSIDRIRIYRVYGRCIKVSPYSVSGK
eukprot:scaffold1440_cov332-Pavlova_lutheri.AAC.34